MDMDILKLVAQVITCRAKLKSKDVGGKFSFIYGASTTSEREELWLSLNQEDSSEPWLLMGDFNATLKEEGRGGEMSIVEPDQNFVDCVTNLNMNDLPSTGCFYTWVNRRTGSDAIAAKLDRVLANGEWMSRFPYSKTHFAEPTLSDHCGIEIKVEEVSHRRPKPFRFFNCWSEHPDFHPLVQSVWQQQVESSAMFQISQKLKSLKSELKRFNKEKFLSNLKASLALENKLKEVQKNL